MKNHQTFYLPKHSTQMCRLSNRTDLFIQS